MVHAGYNPSNSDMDHRIYIVCTDFNASDCTCGCTDPERESALKADSRKKIPLLHQWIKVASTAWRSDALTNWATSHPHVWFQALLTVGMFGLSIAHPRLSVPHFVSLWGVETSNADDKYVRLVCFLLHASINRFTALTSRSKKACIYCLREATAFNGPGVSMQLLPFIQCLGCFYPLQCGENMTIVDFFFLSQKQNKKSFCNEGVKIPGQLKTREEECFLITALASSIAILHCLTIHKHWDITCNGRSG